MLNQISISERLRQQMAFIIEIDKLKHIMRRNKLVDGSRQENDAEHSWHLAMMVMVLAEYAEAGIDTDRVLRMLLLHDLVEIDAGDTFLYDETSVADTKTAREQQAAARLYGLLPLDIATELKGLWEEFEERKTPEAKFAAAIDRIQPVLHNYLTQGGAWKEHQVSAAMVLKKISVVAEGSPVLGKLVDLLIADAVKQGDLK
jgi:putative hydrolase of HD superfamily